MNKHDVLLPTEAGYENALVMHLDELPLADENVHEALKEFFVSADLSDTHVIVIVGGDDGMSVIDYEAMGRHYAHVDVEKLYGTFSGLLSADMVIRGTRASEYHEGGNDCRDGFYREFEGKRRDGSFRRPRRRK